MPQGCEISQDPGGMDEATVMAIFGNYHQFKFQRKIKRSPVFRGNCHDFFGPEIVTGRARRLTPDID